MAVANALQLEAARATPLTSALSRFNSDVVPTCSFKSQNLSITVERFCYWYIILRCDLDLWPCDLNIWPLTLNIYTVSPATCWNSVRNLNAIEHSAAELLPGADSRSVHLYRPTKPLPYGPRRPMMKINKGRKRKPSDSGLVDPISHFAFSRFLVVIIIVILPGVDMWLPSLRKCQIITVRCYKLGRHCYTEELALHSASSFSKSFNL